MYMDNTKQFFRLMEAGYKERRNRNSLSLEMLKGIIEAYYN